MLSAMLIPVLICIIFIFFTDYEPFKEIKGGVIGSLIGAISIIVGVWFDRRCVEIREKEEKNEKRKKAIGILTTDLVSISLKMLKFAEMLESALLTKSDKNNRGRLPERPDFRECLTSSIPILSYKILGENYLLIDTKQIDVMQVLQQSTLHLDSEIHEVAEGKYDFDNRLTLDRLSSSLSHVLRLLAEAFEKIAPGRRFSLENQETKLGSEFLRRRCEDLEECRKKLN